jgi:hypothetical protein
MSRCSSTAPSGTTTVRRLQQALGVGRIVAGGGPWLAPELAWRQSGVSEQTAADPEAQLLGRLFGSRDVVLGAALLAARTPESTRRILRAGLVVDALDLAAALMARPRMSAKGFASMAGGAAAAIAVAVVSELAGPARSDPRTGRG